MLELTVEDFAIIEHVHVKLTPGFSVLTGETGAGKSLMVDAVGQLLGERADTGMVRSGCETASIEGLFEERTGAAGIGRVLEEYGIEPESLLILRREIQTSGRSIARVNGRAVPIRALAEIGAVLVDIHGQSESVSLKREPEHVELLDRYAGLEADRATLRGLTSRLRETRSELEGLSRNERELARRAELLAFEVEEIEAARLSVEEEEELTAERTRLANAERLAMLADTAYQTLRGEASRGPAALDQLGEGLVALERLVEIDPSLREQHDALLAANESISEVASTILAYRDRLEFDPARLELVEERLAGISDLKRKYGGDIPAILAHAASASEELAALSSAEDRIEALSAESERLLEQVGEVAERVSQQRAAAAEKLAPAVEVELEELGMPGSRFEVELTRSPDAAGVPVDGERYAFDETGIDRVAFLVSTNPGEPVRPLVKVASGGETARLMLALKSILTAADRTPTLIFDEIDAGIGGRVGAVVGQKLWGLAERHQVLCVTHLPQVAAYADTHFLVRKAVADERTAAMVGIVEGDERVSELTTMLGRPTEAARDNARQLLQHSELWKVTKTSKSTGSRGD